jgi:hypothetical protein
MSREVERNKAVAGYGRKTYKPSKKFEQTASRDARPTNEAESFAL